jgi:aryl-phospho-beta-D-glucosidase BglC (GH1 family)
MRSKVNIRQLKRLVFGLILSASLTAGMALPGRVIHASDTGGTQVDLGERFLKTDGKVLRNNSGTGDVIILRGTNIGGWQVMEQWMCPTNAGDQRTAIETLTERFGREKAEELFKIYESSWIQEQDLDNIRDLNFNTVRLPVSCYNLLDDNGKLRADTLETLDWFVKGCEEREIYVILDLHAAPGSQNGRDHSGDKSGSRLFKDKAYQDLTAALWEQLAEHYKGNPTIAGYDLLNEAEGDEQERWPWGKVQLPFFDRLYKVIRAVDPDHIIIMNAVWEPSNIPDPSEYGWENVMYEYHYYCWDGTDNTVIQNNFTDSKVRNDRQAGHEVPVLIGEFTLFEQLGSWEHALQAYEDNGWSWTTWTYKTVDMGNWGIYNSKSSVTPKVNIYNDSAETIADKWSRLDTASYFKKNTYLADLLKIFADKEAAKASPRKWFREVSGEEALKAALRSGEDAEAEIVSGASLYDGREGDVICLSVTGPEKVPKATTRNVCIPPQIRNSVDATGLPCLVFYALTKEGNRAFQVTLVDKNGATWSGNTSPAAKPVANQWSRVFADIGGAAVDISAITEIRIGVNVSGTYYFDDFYFAGSYADLPPDETPEDMEKDMGVKGVITDWDIPAGGTSKAGKSAGRETAFIILFIAVILASAGMLFIFMKKSKTK